MFVTYMYVKIRFKNKYVPTYISNFYKLAIMILIRQKIGVSVGK